MDFINRAMLFGAVLLLCFVPFLSSTITSNYTRYGDIGVVLSLMSFLIAIGVVWRLRRTTATDSAAAGESN